MRRLSAVAALLAASAAFAAPRPVPSEALAARLADESLEIMGIVHFGLNTFTGKEWGYGDEKPKLFNPEEFDAGEIVRGCKAAGIGGLVVVAKHHDGFCLWPTKTTGHNISLSPWRGGKGDYVREMAEACRKEGVKFGVYVSPWDRNNPYYAQEAYIYIFHRQLKELLTGYGEIFEVWFDGANGGTGWYGGAKEKRTIPHGYYRFHEIGRFVAELQPKACAFGGTDWATMRWPGNERGILPPDCRATMPRTSSPRYDALLDAGAVDGEIFQAPEADFPLRKGWFHRDSEKGTTRTGEQLMKTYLDSVGNGGIMNIGVAPTADGVLDADDVRELRRFGEIRREFFAREISDDGEFNVVVLKENLVRGEQVDSWEFLADSRKVLSGKSVGIKRIRILDAPVKAKKCEFKCIKDGGDFRGVAFRRYYVDPALIAKVMGTSRVGETQTAVMMQAGSQDPKKADVKKAKETK